MFQFCNSSLQRGYLMFAGDIKWDNWPEMGELEANRYLPAQS